MPDRMLQTLALALIRLYQRRLSPRKGFRCAYSVHTGARPCSALGYRAIRWRGLWIGLMLLRQRLQRCGAEHRRRAPPRPLLAQRGDCDLSCVDLPCDGGDADCGRGAHGKCSALDGLRVLDGCNCDWPWGNREQKPRKRRERQGAKP